MYMYTGWVSDLAHFIFLVTCVTCVLGIVTNALNMAVFVKIGFKESINVCFFALAVSDFLLCLSIFFVAISQTKWAYELLLEYDIHQEFLLLPYVHLLSLIGMTPLLTTYITLERCLCVAMPLKVKTIFTPNRAAIVIASLLFVCIISTTPHFFTTQPGYVYDPIMNKTLLSVVYSEKYKDLDSAQIIFFLIMEISYNTFTLVFTCILISQLRKSNKKWLKNNRQSSEISTSAASENNNSRYMKSKKTSKMVVTMSSIFLMCYLPELFIHIFSLFYPDLHPDGTHYIVYYLVYGAINLLAAINASTNIFVYYIISTTYKATYDFIFRVKRGE